MGLDWALIVTSNGGTSSSTLSRSRPQVSQRTLVYFSGLGRGACHLVLLLLLCSSSCVDYASDGLIKIHLFSPSTGMTQCVNTDAGKRKMPQFMFSLALPHGLLHSGTSSALRSLSSCCSLSLLSGTTVHCATCALKWPSVLRLEQHKGYGIAGSFQFISY